MTPTMDHAGLSMADYAAAKRFYAAALAPLGMRLTLEFPKEKTGDFDVGMFGEPGQQVLFIISGGGRTSPALHFAFRAENRAVSTPSMLRRWPPAAATTGRPESARTITRTITPPSSSIPTGTTSRRYATSRCPT